MASEIMRHIDEISEFINDLEIRSEYAAGSSALYACIVHAKSISLLVKSGLYPSAYALIRVMFESYVSGRWLLDIASNEDRGKFFSGKLELDTKKTIYNINKIDPEVGEVILAFWNQYWKSMHSYTHTGSLPLTRLFGADYVGWEPDHDEIKGVTSLARSILIFSVSRIIDLSDTEQGQELAQKLLLYVSKIK